MRLLVVDDDVSVGKLLRAIFDQDGWEVANVTSGEECLTMVRDAPPDIIVLDNMMPGLTGIETALAKVDTQAVIRIVDSLGGAGT